MKLFRLWVSLLPVYVGAGASSPRPTASDLSTCALQCVIQSAPQAHCDVLDMQCQCTSTNMSQITTSCMTANCTIEESFTLNQVSATQCNKPHDSRQSLVTQIGAPATAIVLVVIGLRVWARARGNGMDIEDWVHVAAGGIAMILAGFGLKCASLGLGKHVYDLDSIQNVVNILFWFYLSQVFWPLSTLVIKLAILFLYLKIFQIRSFHFAVWAVIIGHVVQVVFTVPVNIFQCSPVKATWDIRVKQRHCLSVANLNYANTSLSIIFDLAVWVLPMPVLHTLQLPGRKKIGLYALFSAGAFIIAVVAARLPTLHALVLANDATYDIVAPYLWSCGELVIIHLCAGAPAIKSLISSFFRSESTPTSTSSHSGRSFSKPSISTIKSSTTRNDSVTQSPYAQDPEKGAVALPPENSNIHEHCRDHEHLEHAGRRKEMVLPVRSNASSSEDIGLELASHSWLRS